MPIGNIRNIISKNADALKEGGAAALGTLILGGSKAEAAVAGVGQAILTKLVGPLGKFVGIAAVATRGIYNLTKAWATMGTGAASKLETVQNQLRVMLKGLDAAKQRVRELRNFAAVTPFKLPDIVQGNRALESLTRGALTTTQAMRQVGDAAAQAGVSFEDMAVYVGRLYDGLAAGRPVGEVLFRLAELGVVSGTARTAIEKLQESGAGFSEVWRVVEGELKRSSGTMAYTGKTLEGLQSTLDDTQDELKATFSENFLEGQKQAIEAQIQTLENLKPAVQGAGDAFSGFVNVTSTLTSKLAAFVTGLPGVSAALDVLARAAALCTASVLALATAIGGVRLLGMLGALTTRLGLGGKALLLFGAAARGAGAALMAVAWPLTVLVTVLSVVIGLWSSYSDRVARLEKAQREYAATTDALNDKLKAQADSIRNLDQLAASYAATLDELSKAYADSAQAAADLEEARSDDGFLEKRGLVELSDARDARIRKENADKRVAMLQNRVRGLDQVDRGGLEKNAFYTQAQASLAESKRAEEDAAREAARMTMSPAEQAAALEDDANRLARRRAQAMTEVNGSEAYRQQTAAVGDALAKNKTAQVDANARLKQERERYSNSKDVPYDEYRKAAEAVAKLEQEEKRLLDQQMAMAQAQDSEIVKLQARVAMYEKYQAAVQDVNAVKTKLRELEQTPEDESSDARAERLRALKVAQDELRQKEANMARLKTVSGADMTPEQAQQANADLELKKRQANADLVNRAEEIRKRAEAEQARRAQVKTRLDAQGSAREQAALETRGEAAAAEEALVTEKARLELQKQYKEIDDEIYRQRKAVLESQERMLAREKAKRNEAAAGELSVMQAGYDGGAMAQAQEQLRVEEERLRLAMQRGEIERSIYDKEVAKLELSKKELERRRQMARGENAGEFKAGGLDLEAKAARLAGRGAEARRLEEEAQRVREEAGKEGRVREIMDQTGASEAEARAQAEQEIGRNRQGRALDREGGLLQALLGRGQVVDSMQRVGLGGGAAPAPDIKKVVERLDKLIQAVKQQDRGEARLR